MTDAEVHPWMGSFHLLSGSSTGDCGVALRVRDQFSGREYRASRHPLRPELLAHVPRKALLALLTQVGGLSHPNLLSTHEVLLDDTEGDETGPHYSLACLATPPPVTTAADRIRAHSVGGPAAVRTLLRDVSSALMFLHDNGLAHGWLRAGTVALTEDGRWVLLDAMLRRLVDDLHTAAAFSLPWTAFSFLYAPTHGETSSPAAEGSAGAAVEKLRAERRQSDMHSLGLLILELLTETPAADVFASDDASVPFAADSSALVSSKSVDPEPLALQSAAELAAGLRAAAWSPSGHIHGPSGLQGSGGRGGGWGGGAGIGGRGGGGMSGGGGEDGERAASSEAVPSRSFFTDPDTVVSGWLTWNRRVSRWIAEAKRVDADLALLAAALLLPDADLSWCWSDLLLALEGDGSAAPASSSSTSPASSAASPSRRALRAALARARVLFLGSAGGDAEADPGDSGLRRRLTGNDVASVVQLCASDPGTALAHLAQWTDTCAILTVTCKGPGLPPGVAAEPAVTAAEMMHSDLRDFGGLSVLLSALGSYAAARAGDRVSRTVGGLTDETALAITRLLHTLAQVSFRNFGVTVRTRAAMAEHDAIAILVRLFDAAPANIPLRTEAVATLLQLATNETCRGAMRLLKINSNAEIWWRERREARSLHGECATVDEASLRPARLGPPATNLFSDPLMLELVPEIALVRHCLPAATAGNLDRVDGERVFPEFNFRATRSFRSWTPGGVAAGGSGMVAGGGAGGGGGGGGGGGASAAGGDEAPAEEAELAEAAGLLWSAAMEESGRLWIRRANLIPVLLALVRDDTRALETRTKAAAALRSMAVEAPRNKTISDLNRVEMDALGAMPILIEFCRIDNLNARLEASAALWGLVGDANQAGLADRMRDKFVRLGGVELLFQLIAHPDEKLRMNFAGLGWFLVKFEPARSRIRASADSARQLQGEWRRIGWSNPAGWEAM